jgi:hypothetical protein
MVAPATQAPTIFLLYHFLFILYYFNISFLSLLKKVTLWVNKAKQKVTKTPLLQGGGAGVVGLTS